MQIAIQKVSHRVTGFLALLLLFAANPATAQPGIRTEETKIQETVRGLFDGIAALDMAVVERNITPGFMLLESGAIWNLDSLAARLEPLRKMSFKRTNQLRFLKTEVSRNTAWTAYNNTAYMTINGKQRNVVWLESAVLRKVGKKWKVSLLHSTTVPPQN